MKEGCEAKKHQPNKLRTPKNNDQVLPNEVKAAPRDKWGGGISITLQKPSVIQGVSQHLIFMFLDHASTVTTV